MEHENMLPSDSKASKRRAIIEHDPSVSLLDLPSVAFVNILSRLPLDDIFTNYFFVCKSITTLIIELIENHPHYFTKIYKENYPNIYFLVTKPQDVVRDIVPLVRYTKTYFGELRKADEIERTPMFFGIINEYVFDTTRWTSRNLKCGVDHIRVTSYLGIGRPIVVPCNGILCLTDGNNYTNRHIIVTNPLFGHVDDVVLPYPTCTISEVSTTSYFYHPKKVRMKGNALGFGCTRNNANTFKVIIVKKYVYRSKKYVLDYVAARNRIIPTYNEDCVKSTCEIRTLGIDQDWRVLPEEDCWFLCCHSHTFVTFDGTFFWIGHCSTPRCVCVAFDIEDEKARSIELPPRLGHIDEFFGGLVILGKNLCLYDNESHQDQIIIWKMNMMGTTIEDNIWNVEFIIDKNTLVPSLRNRVLYEPVHYVPITKMPSGELMIFCATHGQPFLNIN